MTFLVAVPGVALCMLNVYLGMTPEAHEPPPFVPYEHLRIRNKVFLHFHIKYLKIFNLIQQILCRDSRGVTARNPFSTIRTSMRCPADSNTPTTATIKQKKKEFAKAMVFS